MEKQILLPVKVKREMMRTLNVGRMRLGAALKFQDNSPRARLLRAAALQRGGLIYTGAPKSCCLNVETCHDQVQDMIYQNFGDRVELQVSREINVATIIIDHKPVATFNDMTIGTWGDVLYSLQKIYNQLNA